MDAITTPIKSNTDTTRGPIWTSESVISTERMPQGDNIISPADGPFTPSRRRISSTLSTGSSNTSTSSTFSSQLNDYSSSVGTPLTPPSTEDAESKGQNPLQWDSEQSTGEILQSEKFEGNRGADQRHSTPQPENGVIEFGSGLVYGHKFSLVVAMGYKSSTPKNVSGQDLNTEAEQHFLKPGEPNVASNDSETHPETEDGTLEDSRSSRKARIDGASLIPTGSLSDDAQVHLVNGPPLIPIAIPTTRPPSRDSSFNRPATPSPKASLETTASLITSREVEVVGSPSDNTAVPSHNAGNGTPEEPNTTPEDLKTTPEKQTTPEKLKVTSNKLKRTRNKSPSQSARRQSARLLQKNQVTINASATTDPNVEESDFPLNVNEKPSSQNLGKQMRGLDEHEAIPDEYLASTTDGRAPGPRGREPAEAAEVVQPSIEVGEKPDADTTERAGSIQFKQHGETKSPSEIKAEILRIILKGDKEDKQGFVYIYKVEGSNGHVKIGKSRQKQGKRLMQWNGLCKLKPERICDPNHRRLQYYGMVEELAQMELSNERKTYQCDVCRKMDGKSPKEHKEWFKVTEKHALEVVERWRGWLVQHQPYGLDGTLLDIWEWKHNKLSKANTVDFKEWVILTRSDEYAYAWHRIDGHLQKELKKPILRSSLAINAALVAVTLIWCESGAFLASCFVIVILFMFLKYSS
jgi:hypothetical protein